LARPSLQNVAKSWLIEAQFFYRFFSESFLKPIFGHIEPFTVPFDNRL